MTLNELRKIAKGMGVNTYRVKNPDIICPIQRAENIQCFDTQRAKG